MRLVMMCTGPFGAPTFRALYETGHTVAALVTAPLRAKKGGKPAPAGPARQIAQDAHTPIFDPADVNTDAARERLVSYQADLLVVCDYGQILSGDTLAAARLGGINLHGSLLPRYRGAAPVNWAIYHGEKETGISLIHMSPRLDAGPIVAQDRTPIGPDETTEQVEARLAEIGAHLVRQTLPLLEAGECPGIVQDSTLASNAPRLKKSDGLVDWTRTAGQVKDQIRAVQPWPKAYTFWRRRDGRPLRLIIGSVSVAPSPDPTAAPGTVVESSPDLLLLATESGAVAIQTLQPAGKRMLTVTEFLRGYPVQSGDEFGEEG